jgi:hypothetical protein
LEVGVMPLLHCCGGSKRSTYKLTREVLDQISMDMS